MKKLLTKYHKGLNRSQERIKNRDQEIKHTERNTSIISNHTMIASKLYHASCLQPIAIRQEHHDTRKIGNPRCT